MSGRILVCGSRSYSAWQTIWSVLNGVYADHEVGYMVAHVDPLVIIDGGAKGADRIATQWVHSSPLHGPVLKERERPETAPDQCYVMHEPYPAEWTVHDERWCPGASCSRRGRRWCSGAGPRRNQQMLDEGKPDEVWAFVDKPLTASPGTNDMVTRARLLRLPVTVVQTM